MRILQLNVEKGWRGGERQTLLSMEQFVQAGHDVAVLARRDGELARAARQQGITLFEARNPSEMVWHLWQLRKHYDIFHAQTANTLTWLALLKPWLRGKIVFTRRTAFPVQRRQALTRWKWRRADVVVAISQAAAAEPERLGVAVDGIIPSAVIYQPVNQPVLAPLIQRYNPHGKYVIATVAALTREKDPLTMIDAVHQLRQQRDDFVFLHFGSGGALESQARDQVQALGLERSYVFAGFHANIADCYRLMTLFALSSTHEALGSSVLDAFLYDVPVVTTVAGGLADIVADGRGLTCPVGDSQCLAQGMQKLLNNAALRASMATRARDYVHREHGVVQMGERYLTVYGAVIGK